MAKIDPSEMKFQLLFIRREGNHSSEKLIKKDISHKEAEKLQAEIIAKNAAEYEKLTGERRELEESPDGPEKRGKIKALDNKLAELMHPSPTTTFAIRRDYEAEREAARKPKADK